MEETTVKQLIDILQKQDENRIVILSKDSEGNTFSPLIQLEIGKYVPGEAREGTVYPDAVDVDNSKKAIIFYPEH